MKRFINLFLAFTILCTTLPVRVLARRGDDVKRYTVLVLDTSDKADFLDNRTTIYTADTAIDYVKDAAKVFAEDITSAAGENYVAIVSYKATAEIVLDFTDDYDELEREIEDLYSSDTVRDISAGLKCADELINDITDENAIKNVVLCTTGMTNNGNYSYSGHYDENTVGSNWRRMDNQVRLYAYANTAYSVAEQLKQKATIYTLGIFQTMDGMPELGHNIVEFFKLTAKDLASSEENFHEVEDFDNIVFAFGDIADDITNEAKAGTFSYESDGKDYKETFYYHDDYFTRNSTNYDSSLATMSLCVALSAYNSSVSGTDDYSEKDRNVKDLFEKGLGFKDYDSNDWYGEKPTDESIGCAIARREIKDDGEIYNVIAVAVRGGNYESEWASNFTIGKEGQAFGFRKAKEQVLGFIKEYIEEKEVSGNIKLWISGYSRAGATSNLVAAAINDDVSVLGNNVSLAHEDLYAYCFETPMGGLKADIKKVEQYDPDRYKNIHNIINVNDFVPKVAMTRYGFDRYGQDYYLPDKTITSEQVYNVFKDKMLDYYNKMDSYEVAGEYIIDDFVMKRIDLRYILPKGKSFIQEEMSSQGEYLDDFLRMATTEVITSRDMYVEDYQNLVRMIFMIKYGTLLKNYDMEHLNRFIDVLFDKIKDIEYLGELAYYCVRFDEESLQNHIQNLIEESLNECGMNKISPSVIEDLADVVVQLLVKVLISHPNMTITLAGNIDRIKQAHRGELCLAWLKSQDINYTIDPVEFCRTGSYRVIRINCPVDVNIYNSNGDLVAQIKDDEAQKIEGSSLVATLNENGEKVVILPVTDEYSVELDATDDGSVNYNISEFCHSEQANTRVLNYFDVEVKKGDVLRGNIPAYSEDEIEYGTAEGSATEYQLYDADNNLLEPDSDLHGEDAIEAYHMIEAVSDDEEKGVVIGGGQFQYGTFAQLEAAPEEGYKFEGWYRDDELISSEATYRFAVTEDASIVGKFVPENAAGGFIKDNLFMPLIIAIAGLLIILTIIIIIVLRKRRKSSKTEEKYVDRTLNDSRVVPEESPVNRGGIIVERGRKTSPESSKGMSEFFHHEDLK